MMATTMKTPWIVVSASIFAVSRLYAQAAPDEDVAALEAAEPPSVEAEVKASARGGLAVPERTASNERPSNLFAPHSWYTPPPPPPQRRSAPAPAPATPTAPPLPFTFLGSMQRGNEMVYFLTRGDRAYDVKVGDVLDKTYKVEGVSNGRLIFTYLPLATSQGLQIGEPQ